MPLPETFQVCLRSSREAFRMRKTWQPPDCGGRQLFYRVTRMKMDLLKARIALTAAAAATLLTTGCASDRGYSDISGSPNSLAFTSVTAPNERMKWTGDRYLEMSLRSMDTYYF